MIEIDNNPLSLSDYKQILSKLNTMKSATGAGGGFKFKTMEIVTYHGIMSALMSVHEGFKRAFMDSNDNRIKFLTDTHVKVKIQKEGSDDTYKVGDVVDADIKDFDTLLFPYWIEWTGCKMRVPKNAYITFNSQIAWPSIYVKNKQEDGKRLEVSIYERAWDIDIYASDPKKVSYPVQHTLGGGKAESTEPKLITISKNSYDHKDFNHIKVTIKEKLEEFDLVIEIPMIAPFMDVLTEVRFEDHDEHSSVENILMTACCTVPI